MSGTGIESVSLKSIISELVIRGNKILQRMISLVFYMFQLVYLSLCLSDLVSVFSLELIKFDNSLS